MRGRVVERVVRIEPEGLASPADLAQVAYALGRHAERRDFDHLVEELELFASAILERVFRDAHIGLWEEYPGGERPTAEGEGPIGVHLSIGWGDGDEVIVQVPGLALVPADPDPDERRDLARGLRALADEHDRLAEREEKQPRARPDPAAALRGEARLMRFLHGED